MKTKEAQRWGDHYLHETQLGEVQHCAWGYPYLHETQLGEVQHCAWGIHSFYERTLRLTLTDSAALQWVWRRGYGTMGHLLGPLSLV